MIKFNIEGIPAGPIVAEPSGLRTEKEREVLPRWFRPLFFEVVCLKLRQRVLFDYWKRPSPAPTPDTVPVNIFEEEPEVPAPWEQFWARLRRRDRFGRIIRLTREERRALPPACKLPTVALPADPTLFSFFDRQFAGGVDFKHRKTPVKELDRRRSVIHKAFA